MYIYIVVLRLTSTVRYLMMGKLASHARGRNKNFCIFMLYNTLIVTLSTLS